MSQNPKQRSIIREVKGRLSLVILVKLLAILLRRKIKIVMVEKLKPLPLPQADPLRIVRCQYKYSKDNEDYYILADFEGKYDSDGNVVSYANWSKYNYIEDEINSDNPPIMTATWLAKDFHDMINNEGWTKEYDEFVVSR
jgi:hypothetical protein